MDTLFFVLSKMTWLILRPESLGLVLLAIALWGIWRGTQKVAAGAIIVLVLAYVLIAPGFAPKWVLDPLETQYKLRPDLLQVDGIIVLGGGEIANLSGETGIVHLNDAGDRMTTALALANAFPEAKLLFSGGSGRAFGVKFSGGDAAARLFEQLGIARSRINIEGASRNTAENARLLAQEIAPSQEQRWVLVTSAFHMWRAMGSFCAAGWRNITPFPTDYRTLYASWPPFWRFAYNLQLLNIGMREWVGLIAYYVTGRIERLRPVTC